MVTFTLLYPSNFLLCRLLGSKTTTHLVSSINLSVWFQFTRRLFVILIFSQSLLLISSSDIIYRLLSFLNTRGRLHLDPTGLRLLCRKMIGNAVDLASPIPAILVVSASLLRVGTLLVADLGRSLRRVSISTRCLLLLL